MKYIQLFEEFVLNNNYIFDNDYCDYYVRYATHIKDDLERGWSSWNFGKDGFEGSYEELETAKQKAIDNEHEFYISGFDLWDNSISDADIRELYPKYWVLVDNTKTSGIAGHYLPNTLHNVEEALLEINDNIYKYGGDGDFFETEYAKVLYSEEDYGDYGFHIIEVGENQIMKNNLKI